MVIELRRLKIKSEQVKVRVKRGSEPYLRFSLWSDCRGSMFARVAARRQRKSLKEELTHTRSVCVGVAETGVNTFLFLTFGTFLHRKVHPRPRATAARFPSFEKNPISRKNFYKICKTIYIKYLTNYKSRDIMFTVIRKSQ